MDDRDSVKMKENWDVFKLKMAIIPAVIFWLVSSVCFIFGLQFTPMMIGNINMGIMIAVGLSISNTVIQLIGNDQSLDDIGYIMFTGWMLSYVLGIGSNVNTLLNILQMPFPVLEWAVAIGLGAMIEILPEKLILQYIRTLRPLRPKVVKVQNSSKDDSKDSSALSSIRKQFGRPTPAFGDRRTVQSYNGKPVGNVKKPSSNSDNTRFIG